MDNWELKCIRGFSMYIPLNLFAHISSKISTLLYNLWPEPRLPLSPDTASQCDLATTILRAPIRIILLANMCISTEPHARVAF